MSHDRSKFEELWIPYDWRSVSQIWGIETSGMMHVIEYSAYENLMSEVRPLLEALEAWNDWAESMVEEGVLDASLIAEYHEAEQALANFKEKMGE